jgi:hypothetical protein
VVATAVGGGAVNVTPEQTTYSYGTPVEVDAEPDSGWAFVGWSGDTTGTDDPLSFVVTCSRAMTATFHDVALPRVELLAPLGGEHWEAGQVMYVHWTATDNAGVDSVDVDYTVTGPDGPWLPIAHGYANSGSVDWTLPEQTADSARVRVIAHDVGGNTVASMSPTTFVIEEPGPVAVETGRAVLALSRPLPNPSRGSVSLRFSLPASGHARLEVLDLSGRRMMAAEGDWPAGPSLVRWEAGGRAPAGLYFVRLTTPWGTRAERLVRLD